MRTFENTYFPFFFSTKGRDCLLWFPEVSRLTFFSSFWLQAQPTISIPTLPSIKLIFWSHLAQFLVFLLTKPWNKRRASGKTQIPSLVLKNPMTTNLNQQRIRSDSFIDIYISNKQVTPNRKRKHNHFLFMYRVSKSLDGKMSKPGSSDCREMLMEETRKLLKCGVFFPFVGSRETTVGRLRQIG